MTKPKPDSHTFTRLYTLTVRHTTVQHETVRTHLDLQVPAAWKMVQVQNCTTGQVQQNAAICSTCPAATFPLNPLNESCDACPAGATCFGDSHFIPPSQSWHSHPYSTNIVQCPNAKRCQGDRTTLLNCTEVDVLVPTNLGFPFHHFTVIVASCALWQQWC